LDLRDVLISFEYMEGFTPSKTSNMPYFFYENIASDLKKFQPHLNSFFMLKPKIS